MSEEKENKMGTWPVGKLLVSMSLPAMFSMLILALYNIVDSIFVSRINETALTALSLAFPMQQLTNALSVGLSIGVTAAVSRRLGEKRNDEANNTAQSGYTITVILGVVGSIIGLTLSKAFICLFTDDPLLIEYVTEYLTICIGMVFFMFIQVFTEKILQSTGDTVSPMIIQLVGAVFNIIFDPIFIFGYFGLPAMGVKGAAIATVAGQILSLLVGLVYVKRSKFISVKFFKLRFNREEYRNILVVGIPSIILQGIGTVMTSCMNAVLIAYDVIATTVFGVYFKLQSFAFMPIFGMNQGLLPILGYNYGAKNKKRMIKALKLAILLGECIMITCLILCQLIPDKLLGLFNASEAMLKIGVPAIRIISLSFPVAVFTIVIGSLFQCLGDGSYSMIVSVVRQLVFLVPLAWLLGKLFGLGAIWYAFIIADLASLAVTLIFLQKERRKLTF